MKDAVFRWLLLAHVPVYLYSLAVFFVYLVGDEHTFSERTDFLLFYFHGALLPFLYWFLDPEEPTLLGASVGFYASLLVLSSDLMSLAFESKTLIQHPHDASVPVVILYSLLAFLALASAIQFFRVRRRFPKAVFERAPERDPFLGHQ